MRLVPVPVGLEPMIGISNDGSERCRAPPVPVSVGPEVVSGSSLDNSERSKASTEIRSSISPRTGELESQPVMDSGSFPSWYQPFRTAQEGSFSSVAVDGLLTPRYLDIFFGSSVNGSWLDEPTTLQSDFRFGTSEEEVVLGFVFSLVR